MPISFPTLIFVDIDTMCAQITLIVMNRGQSHVMALTKDRHYSIEPRLQLEEEALQPGLKSVRDLGS